MRWIVLLLALAVTFSALPASADGLNVTKRLRAKPLARAADRNPAAPPSQQFPGQRAAPDDPWLGALLRGAQEFWRARGVSGVPGAIIMDVADDVAEKSDPNGNLSATGYGWDPRAPNSDARIALDAKLVYDSLAKARRRSWSVRDRRYALRQLMATIYHEVGHVSGLPHSEGGLMSGTDATHMPGDGLSQIRRLVKRS